MSMACGFEVRVPFCDYRLVDYVWNVPWDQKTTGGIEKGVLRRRSRTSCRTTCEGIRQRGLVILKDPNAAVRPYVDVASLYRRAEAPAPADVALTYTLEQIIQIEGWLKAYRIEVDIRSA